MEDRRRVMLVILAAIVIVLCDPRVEGSKSLRDLVMEGYPNRINKPVVKIIKSEDGDVIDCIDIYRQPAFNHPLLKNHTIQMRPSRYPVGMQREVPDPQLQLTWQNIKSCPEGTVPIPTTRRRDLKSIKTVTPMSSLGHESSSIQAMNLDSYGAKAEINVWNPLVEPNEFTACKISIYSSTETVENNIQAGWIVHPVLFGDYKTRLFAYWTASNSTVTKLGCFNTVCAGFVQVSSKIFPGAPIIPLSIYNGPQYSFRLWYSRIKKLVTGGAWMFGDEGVGYWPSSLFGNTFNHSSLIEWGGEVVNTGSSGQHTTTQMGSGHFSPEGFGKSGHFRNILVVDFKNNYRVPDGVKTYTDKPQCYDLNYNGQKIGKDVGYAFHFVAQVMVLIAHETPDTGAKRVQ